MWFDDLPIGATWSSLWKGYIRCGNCSGIRKREGLCPACQLPVPEEKSATIQLLDGHEHHIRPMFMGAEGRYEDWVYLNMLEREWARPITDADRFLDIPESHRPAVRSAFVLVFWSYFETRIERLIREGMSNIPESVTKDLFRRYSSIGSRLDRLYKVIFDTTYWLDLKDLGFERISTFLKEVQRRRNAFIHGHPEAIDDALIADLVANLKDEHESWIAVFNRRATRRIH